MAMRASAAIALVGERDWSLHHRPAASIHVELAARKPAEVGRIGRIEKQQRGLPAGNVEVDLDCALAVFGADFKPCLAGDARNHLRLDRKSTRLNSSHVRIS